MSEPKARLYRPPAGRRSVRDLCGMMGIHRDTLREMRRRGEIPLPKLIFGRLSWDAEEIDPWVDAWIEAHPRVRVAGPQESAA